MSWRLILPLSALTAVVLTSSPARSQVYEVIHPEVEKGRFELEALNGVVLSGRETGEERSAHEFAIGYAPTSFWMPKLALELANPEGEDVVVEAFEFENVFVLFQSGHGHAGHGHGHSHDDDALTYALGFYGKLEVPNEGGFDEGALELGPIGEISTGAVSVIGNFLVDLPFEENTDPGLTYALQASTPLAAALAAGFEAHGSVAQAFGDAPGLDEQEHVVGPALYAELDLGDGRVLEPRAALLFGLTEAAPDATLSFNLELKF
jgi:hypothetical protein